MFDTTHMLERLAQGVAVAAALAALVVPSSLASTGSRYGSHDPWFAYARSLDQASARDPWFNYALSLTNGANPAPR